MTLLFYGRTILLSPMRIILPILINPHRWRTLYILFLWPACNANMWLLNASTASFGAVRNTQTSKIVLESTTILAKERENNFIFPWRWVAEAGRRPCSLLVQRCLTSEDNDVFLYLFFAIKSIKEPRMYFLLLINLKTASWKIMDAMKRNELGQQRKGRASTY